MTAIRPAIRSPPSHLLALPNVTASVPVIVMLYNDRCSAVLMYPIKSLAPTTRPCLHTHELTATPTQ